MTSMKKSPACCEAGHVVTKEDVRDGLKWRPVIRRGGPQREKQKEEEDH